MPDLAREANGTLVSHRVRDRRSRCDDPYRHRKTPAAMELLTFLPLIIILGAFMFFASRRQRKAMQAIRFAQQVEQYDHRLELEKRRLELGRVRPLRAHSD